MPVTGWDARSKAIYWFRWERSVDKSPGDTCTTYRSYQENRVNALTKSYLGRITSTWVVSSPSSGSTGRRKFVSCANKAIRMKLVPCRTEHIPIVSQSQYAHRPCFGWTHTENPPPVSTSVHNQTSKGATNGASTTDHEGVKAGLGCSLVEEVQVGDLPRDDQPESSWTWLQIYIPQSAPWPQKRFHRSRSRSSRQEEMHKTVPRRTRYLSQRQSGVVHHAS